MAARRKTIPPKDPVFYLFRTRNGRVWATYAWGPPTSSGESEARTAVAAAVGCHPGSLFSLASATGPVDVSDLVEMTSGARQEDFRFRRGNRR